MAKKKGYNMNPKRMLKALNVLSFILTFFALVILKTSGPVAHYEISIYSSIPSFWIFIISATLIGIVSMVYQVYAKYYKIFWLSFLALILDVFIILSLPFFRGYYMYGGNDPNAHLQMSLSIIASGYISEDNFYPITHILGAIFIELSSIRPEIIINLLAVIFTILFMVFTYFLTASVSPRKEYAVLSSAASVTFLFSYYHVTTYPQALSLFLFPLVFYLYFKSSNATLTGWKVMLIILLIIMPFTHPVTAIVLISCLIASDIGKAIFVKKITLNATLISFITFFIWYSNFAIFSGQIQRVNNWLFSEIEKIPRKEEVIPVLEMGKEESLELFIKMCGHISIYLILSIIASFLIIIAAIKKKEEIKNYFIILALFLVSSFSYLLLFMAGSLTTFGRFLGNNVGMWVTPVLTAFVLFSGLKRNKKVGVALTIILMFAFTLSTFSVYRSPWILQPNWHFTYHDVSAINWKNEHIAGGFGNAMVASPIGHVKRGSWKWAQVEDIRPHFGYSNYSTLGESLSKDTIIEFGEHRQRSVSRDPRLEKSPVMGMWAFPEINEGDIDKLLEQDESVNILYSNGDNMILLVRSVK